MVKRTKVFDFDVIIIGSGSGGGVAAHSLANAGKKVAIVEADHIGGECPNFGCVPTKALLQSAEVYETTKKASDFGIKVTGTRPDFNAIQKWREQAVYNTGTHLGDKAFGSDGISVFHAKAHFIDKHTVSLGNKRISAKKFIISTGTKDVVPPIEGLRDVGYITYKDAIALKTMPKKLFIIGGGAIGCEFAQYFSSFETEVHMAEFAPRLLFKEDGEIGDLVKAIFEMRGLKVHTSTKVTSVRTVKGKKVVYFETEGDEHQATVDEILLCAGKAPNTDLGLENAGVEYTRRGITVNDQMQTTAPHIYSTGDVVGPYAFTHMASYQSRIASHNILHRDKIVAKYHAVPRCVFIEPEVASVGLTEAEARQTKKLLKISAVPISILGRSNTSQQDVGFVKVIAESKKGTILGASIVAPRAGEMLHELALAVNLGLTVDDIASTIHAFPTWSEAVRVACAKLKQ